MLDELADTDVPELSPERRRKFHVCLSQLSKPSLSTTKIFPENQVESGGTETEKQPSSSPVVSLS